jgi:predicted small metal-binding protein
MPKLRLRCPCGETIDADSEDELVALANAHLEAEHPELVGRYSRDDILFMAS